MKVEEESGNGKEQTPEVLCAENKKNESNSDQLTKPLPSAQVGTDGVDQQSGSSQVATDVGTSVSQEDTPASSGSDSHHPQTLYVAIQPGAESGQTEHPAVYLEVVEAGSGTEVASSDGQVNLVQEEMVIDNAASTEVTTIPTSVFSQVMDQATLSTMQAEMIAVQVLSQSATGDIQYLQHQSPRFIPIVTSADASTINSLQATLSQMPLATLQINSSQPGATTQTIQLPGGQTIQVPLSVTQMSALASATTESGGASSGANSMTTNTEAIIAAATNAEAAAAVAQEQGATLVTVHPAVIEAPLNATEGQANEGEENEGDDDGKPKYTCEICGKSYIRSWSYYGHMREHASGEKQHKCDVCGKVFNYASNLRQHVLIHTGEKPYECEYCDKAFNNPSSLRSHVLSHSEDKPYICDHPGCGKAFNNPGSLRVHRRVHQEEKPHKCEVEGCDKAFKTPAELSRHAFRHTGEKPHKCDQCDKAFIRYDDLKRHYRIHTGEKPFKCDQCDFACIQSFDLVKHKFTHSGDKPYKCDVCPKQFTRPARLRDHMRTHTGEKPYICDVCGKGFAIQTGLKSHQDHVPQAVHTGDKPFKCDECEKTFRTQLELQSHMGRHTGVKPFKCDICGKEFISTITFKRHAIVHSGEKPFQCPECGRRFARSTDLKVHMPVHSEDKPYKCGECEKMFTRFSTLKEHIRTHTGERPFKCNVCSREFNHRSHFNNHLRIHTGEKPFKCEICEKDFSRKASLRYHMKVHNKSDGRVKIRSNKKGPEEQSDTDLLDEQPHDNTSVEQTMSEQTISTVNIGHLGNEAEVQLAEALVAVSEAVVAAAAEVDDNPRVVTVEETAHSSAEDAVLQQHLSDARSVRASILVDPVTQAAVSAGISASDVGHSVVETVVSTSMSQVVDIPASGSEVAVGVGIPHGQVHIMEVADATGTSDVQTAIGEAMQAGHVTIDTSDALGITVPAEILAAMAAAQSHPHLLIATADQQLMQAQVNVGADQPVLEAHGASGGSADEGGLRESTETVDSMSGREMASTLGTEQVEQPMETE
ncbi:Zinc finger protein 665 [Acropora cervicornis]|uniref:Zinc finger protein 665 n=1 Tax=Acropora cervicornis TaxID=6130 RepID=A0AAD9R723_ACRCE|nr:Zinc finger protein 665 [Acropora cervicornis]